VDSIPARNCAFEVILDRQHVAREARRGVARRLILLRLQPAAHVLRFGRSVEGLRLRLLELLFEFRNAVVLGDFRSAFGRFLADFLRGLVQLFFVFGCFCHAINLVSAFAVKSTMGTTRA
jgi:hypothetical protein